MLFYVMLFLASLAIATLIMVVRGLIKSAQAKALRAKKLRIHATHIPTVNGPGLKPGLAKNTPADVGSAQVSQANSVLNSTWNGSIKREERFRPQEPTHGSLNAYLARKREQERANAARVSRGSAGIDRSKKAFQST